MHARVGELSSRIWNTTSENLVI